MSTRARVRQALLPLVTGQERPPRLAITVGDPAGIGPEVVAKFLAAEALAPGSVVVVGHLPTLQHAVRAYAGVEPSSLLRAVELGETGSLGTLDDGGSTTPVIAVGRESPDPFAPAQPSAASGRVALEAIELAAHLALSGSVDAIVTGPLSKEWVARSGVHFIGHTEHFARMAGRRRVVMTMVGGGLRVGVLTTHIALRDVVRSLREADLRRALRIIDAARYLYPDGGRPRIALCGLNPHAGEGGLFGQEEQRLLAPVAAWSQQQGMDVTGPYSADTLFGRALRGEFDYILAMYHDQGLIPVKLLAAGRAVNVTLGLPFVRTSVDHGTAFDVAGRGIADPGSLTCAFRAAETYVTTTRIARS